MLIHTSKLTLMLLMLWNWPPGLNSQDGLDPNGKNVCRSDGVTKGLVCCPGWKQEGRECTAAICEGADQCKKDEVCIRPGVCRCKPGFFGADCNSPCPDQYWSSDCKQRCSCYPNGKCDGKTGQCTCFPSHWGPNCQHHCQCGSHGTCDPHTGLCHCEPGWWSQHCNKSCQCNLETSLCNQTNGQCMCNSGWWGLRCGIKCNCNKSPCLQSKGTCKCREGWYGPKCEHQCDCVHGKCSPINGECDCYSGYHGKRCAEPCSPGYYGPKCQKSCGRCKDGQMCSRKDGSCVSCDPGWNGTRCDVPCSSGYYGENCSQRCPKCRRNEACNIRTGTCQNCDAGKMGARCETSCSARNYGEKCQHTCPSCIYGRCDPVTGDCVCNLGYWRQSCNETCPNGFFGGNCSSACDCGGGPCDPMYGKCLLTSSQKGAIIAGVLVPICLLFLLCCCCCCCGNNQLDSKHSSSDADEGCLSRMKHNFQGTLINISSLLSCCSVGNNKVSWVTVSHHDAELPFNHSFIESPSTGWLSENSFSSFESDEEGPVYCVPPKEGMSVADINGFQEISSKCNMFPDVMALSAEEVSLPFAIPRTSSIAKAKRPSVSFAEGTKFESRRSSTTDTPNLARKPKLAISLPKLPSVQSQATNENESQQDEDSSEHYDTVSPNPEPEEHPKLQRNAPVGRRRTMSNAQKSTFKTEITECGLKDFSSEAKKKSHNLTTVYVSVGPPRKPYKPRRRSEGNVDGAVQAVLKRFGSFQKGIPKPVRKSLLQQSNSRLSQIKNSNEEDSKFSNKHSSTGKLHDNSAKKPVNQTSSILKKNFPEDGHDSCDKPENMYSNLHEAVTLQPGPDTDIAEHIYQTPDGGENSEPKYENVTIPNNFVESEQNPSPLYEDAQMTSET
ncbi:scavenger receptor class F member 1 [Hyperolius riggenbachi]|uniref:scavenger receptor class F member 1 n=1 Tax=Hyperolius riggenbachi TaxID=752182 RepID=UPI0035A399AF